MPKTDEGRSKYHQLFTDDVGHPALAQHLLALVWLRMHVYPGGQAVGQRQDDRQRLTRVRPRA